MMQHYSSTQNQIVKNILEAFGGPSGLRINFEEKKQRTQSDVKMWIFRFSIS